MRLPTVIILLSLLLSACGHGSRAGRVLDKADRIMMSAPDSAVALLESLDMRDAGVSERARHALLLTKARRKAHIIETDDSLIRTAVDYYRGRGDSLEVQSLYYSGVIQKSKKEYPDALILLMEAYDRASANGDDFYRAMSCREQADIYSDLYNFDRAAQLRQEAADAFTKTGRPLHAAWERVFIPQALVYSDRIDEAYDSIGALDSDSLILSDPELRQHFFFNASNVCYLKKDYEQSEKYFDALIDAGDTPSSKLLSQMARLKAEKGETAEARRYWKLATERQEDESDSLAAIWALSDIYKAEGDYKNAYLLNETVEDGQADMINEYISHPYTTLLSNYFRSEANRKSLQLDKSAQQTQAWIIVCIVLMLAIALSAYFYTYRLRQKELEREILIRDLNALEARISEISAINQDLPQDGKDDNQFLLEMLRSICDLQGSYSIENDKGGGFSDKIVDLLTSDDNLQALENYIDRNHDNLMSGFRRQPIVLTERQFQITLFVFLGFSDTTIASLFHLSSSAVRQLRYRIRKRLKENPTPDTETFLRFF